MAVHGTTCWCSFVSHTYFFVGGRGKIHMTIASFLVPKCLHTQLELTIDGCLDTCRARARARARAKGDNFYSRNPSYIMMLTSAATMNTTKSI